jgi:hypothetical protein
MKENKKEKVGIWMQPDMVKQVDAAYPLHEISSRSEFVCKAVEFYLGFLQIPKTAERIEELQASISNVTRFIDKARRYTEITELSAELLNVFIEKIEVGERAERYSRTAEQEIIIHYRDIGVVGAFAEEAEKVAEIRQRQTA